MSRVLTTAQAEAVYRAMCELNNVGGELSAALHDHIAVHGDDTGRVAVRVGLRTVEQYRFQADFAAAYGLDT